MFDEATAERIRQSLSGRDVAERKMMGALCFMTRGHMFAGVMGEALMVRVGGDAYEAALAEPHVRPMIMGTRRATGYVLVDPQGFAGDAALAGWVQRGLDFVGGLPDKRK
jgi:TfoX/Sxy family transcriptional regulator of competence genes